MWIAPIGAWSLGQAYDVPTWPLILAGLLAVVLRRAVPTTTPR
jgi:hypothetical protein